MMRKNECAFLAVSITSLIWRWGVGECEWVHAMQNGKTEGMVVYGGVTAMGEEEKREKVNV